MPVLSGTRSIPLSKPLVMASGLLLLTAVSGCSMLEDRSERYVAEKEIPHLEVPENVDSSRFRQLMPIRDVKVADERKLYSSDIPRPPDMTSEILDQNYAIEELDGRAWLLVNDVPGRIWPVVNAYMANRGLGVSHDNPQLGLLQSEVVNFSQRARDLLELSDGREASTVLQVRIAPGVRRKTTEIQVRKLAFDRRPEQLVPWAGASDEPSAEALALQKRILEDMGEFLKSREDNKSFSRAASVMTAEPLVRLMVSENDEPVGIRMSLDYGRSWAEVQRALAESGIPVVDLNRSEGWFFVDFRSSEERSPGWFGWFSDKEKPVHTHTISLTRRDDIVLITVKPVDSYDGDRAASELLTQLFDYLY